MRRRRMLRDFRILFSLLVLSVAASAQLVVAPTTAACATSIDGSVVLVPNPLTGPSIASSNVGTLAAATYFVQIAWYDAAAHVTLVSPEVQFALLATGQLQVSPPAGQPATAAGMQVFIGTTSGGETLQGSSIGIATYVQSVPLVAGAAEPSSNNTICQVIANDAGWPTGTGYVTTITTPSGQTLPGYPMQWQLLGPGNTINIGQGLPYYNGTVIYPTPILARPYGHATQSISGGLNIGNYPFTAGTGTFSGLVSLLNGGVFNGNMLSSNATLTGSWAVSGTLASSGGTLSGTWAGNPTFSGVPNFALGFQLAGSFGTNGQCATSTGTNVVWASTCGAGGTPSVVVGPGAGTSASVVLGPNSKDKVGSVQLTTGGSPIAGSLFTVTFSSPFPSAAYCTFSPNSSLAVVAVAIVGISSGSPTSWGLFASSGLTATSPYTWNYICNGV